MPRGCRSAEQRGEIGCGCKAAWAASLLDHLVGAQQKGFGNGEADGLGDFEVDDKLDPCRQLDREIGGLCAFEYFVDVIAGAMASARLISRGMI